MHGSALKLTAQVQGMAPRPTWSALVKLSSHFSAAASLPSSTSRQRTTGRSIISFSTCTTAAHNGALFSQPTRQLRGERDAQPGTHIQHSALQHISIAAVYKLLAFAEPHREVHHQAQPRRQAVPVSKQQLHRARHGGHVQQVGAAKEINVVG